jgi:hypothetical protein
VAPATKLVTSWAPRGTQKPTKDPGLLSWALIMTRRSSGEVSASCGMAVNESPKAVAYAEAGARSRGGGGPSARTRQGPSGDPVVRFPAVGAVKQFTSIRLSELTYRLPAVLVTSLRWAYSFFTRGRRTRLITDAAGSGLSQAPPRGRGTSGGPPTPLTALVERCVVPRLAALSGYAARGGGRTRS